MDNINICSVSVIVPVYNAEEYLTRCVDSLLNQSFEDYEIILVDDGSLDASGKICDDYASRYANVRVIHKDNGGVSSARQCGLDNAQGEYVIHADPDDWVEGDMLSDMYQAAIEANADMVICDFIRESYSDGSIQYIMQNPTSFDHDEILREMLYTLHGACWNKLVKRSCFKDYNISFPKEFSLNEDLFVTLSLLKEPIKIIHLPKAYYHYIIGYNTNSITSSNVYSEETYVEDINKITIFSDLMYGHKYYQEVKSTITAYAIRRAYKSSSYSSLDFMRHFLKFRHEILHLKNHPITHVMRLYLSCIGFYALLRYISQHRIYKS